MHFFGQFTDHNSGRKHENQTNDPSFFIYFFCSNCLLTFIFVFANSQNSFSCVLPFGPFLSVKYLNFGKKLPIRTTHHTFLEVDTLRLLKAPLGEPKKGINSWTTTVSFIYMPLPQGSCVQKEFQIYVTCAVDLCYFRI